MRQFATDGAPHTLLLNVLLTSTLFQRWRLRMHYTHWVMVVLLSVGLAVGLGARGEGALPYALCSQAHVKAPGCYCMLHSYVSDLVSGIVSLSVCASLSDARTEDCANLACCCQTSLFDFVSCRVRSWSCTLIWRRCAASLHNSML